jgi:hypothetical protein
MLGFVMLEGKFYKLGRGTQLAKFCAISPFPVKHLVYVVMFPPMYFLHLKTNSLRVFLTFTIFFILKRFTGLQIWVYGRRDPSRWPRGTLYPNKLPLTSPTSGERTIPTEWPRLSAKWLPNLWRYRGCHVVNVTDPYSRILDFLDRSLYFSLK